ncbi:putative carbohydrate esterase (CE1) [Formosa agariphila KMM 3901]|uniref:Putative carbohydrate esterase (CE1) n=1 Tax=Formosa agariphila (strain DSM 15362 / KCTC 12365 / LMG 23005 / KMM 3901 / M-2Alg 35-1) TaxID=1347342 RepID=T2KMX5_FORAG|nr:alpha/beta hydrolase-fold protein [Formosa agariphila]CDF79314.1 putative carbohydrate esterase (CE1) [Formosa agariphila KMM 3901]
MKKILVLLCLTIFSFGCKNKGIVYNDPIPEHDSLTISSSYVNEDRVINVWTPPNYDMSTDRFPVLYMPDGGIKEDFPHIANTLAKLIAAQQIPPYILVGIENTNRRKDLSGPTDVEYDLTIVPHPGGSNNFRGFIKNELFTEINKRYRTQDKRAIIGESAAGIFVIETFLLDNAMFDYYIAMDPALWYNEQYLVKNFESLAKDDYGQQKKLWFAGSDAVDIAQHTKALNETLKQLDLGLQWKYSDEPNEQHNTIFRATKEKAMIWALNE